MKTIVVATDFSGAARNAYLYAVGLAKDFNARIVLVSAYEQIPFPITNTPAVMDEAYMKHRAQHQLEEDAATIGATAAVDTETCCCKGLASDAVLNIAREKQADLLIAGMKATDKKIRKIWGSVVTGLARKTKLPFIVVPEEAHYAPIESIALANEADLDPDTDAHLLDVFCEIASLFHSKTYLVRVAKNSFQESYEVNNRPYTLKGILQKSGASYECIKGNDIPRALNEFVAARQVTMLALLPRKYALWERWFVNSTTRSMIFETHIPLLIMPDPS